MRAQFWVSHVTSFALWTFRMTLGKLAYLRLTGWGWINCIINVTMLKRHEKTQKAKDRSLSPLAVSTAQEVHLVTSG